MQPTVQQTTIQVTPGRLHRQLCLPPYNDNGRAVFLKFYNADQLKAATMKDSELTEKYHANALLAVKFAVNGDYTKAALYFLMAVSYRIILAERFQTIDQGHADAIRLIHREAINAAKKSRGIIKGTFRFASIGIIDEAEAAGIDVPEYMRPFKY